MLTINHIATGYGKKQVIYDVSLNIREGEIILLTGANGSGKSSVLKSIYGVLPLWSGEVLWQGNNINALAIARRMELGLMYVPQKGNVFDDLTAKENLEVCGMALKKAILQERIEETLAWFPDLRALLHRRPERFSGGERQQLALACALLHRPKLLLLDEPTLGLSDNKIQELVVLLQKIARQNLMSMLIVEHRVKELLSISDKHFDLKLGVLEENL